jgi:hypothetical protein
MIIDPKYSDSTVLSILDSRRTAEYSGVLFSPFPLVTSVSLCIGLNVGFYYFFHTLLCLLEGYMILLVGYVSSRGFDRDENCLFASRIMLQSSDYVSYRRLHSSEVFTLFQAFAMNVNARFFCKTFRLRFIARVHSS